MTRYNYRIDKDPDFPVGMETHVHRRRRWSLTNIPGTGALMSNGAPMNVTSTNAVAQATNKSTGVTLSKLDGAITMDAASLAAGTIVSFTLTNTLIGATDVLVLNHISGGTVGSYTLNAQCAAGSATINVRNNTAGALAEAIVIQFVVIKPHLHATHPVNAGATSGLSASADASSTVGAAVNIRTGNASADSVKLMTPFDVVRRDWEPDITFKLSTGASVAFLRIWIGMFSSDPSAAANLNAIHGVAFCYDTAVDTGGAFWSVATGNASSTTRTATSAAIAASTNYVLRMRYNSTTSAMEFYVDGILKTSIATTLPTATQLLGVGVTVTTLTTAVKQMNVQRISISCL